MRLCMHVRTLVSLFFPHRINVLRISSVASKGLTLPLTSFGGGSAILVFLINSKVRLCFYLIFEDKRRGSTAPVTSFATCTTYLAGHQTADPMRLRDKGLLLAYLPFAISAAKYEFKTQVRGHMF